MPLKQPSSKRRRLSLSSPSSPSPHPTPHSVTPVKVAKLLCSTCHRTLKTAQLLSCSRCSALTCTICARTCTMPLVPSASAHQGPQPALPLGQSNTNRRRKADDLDFDDLTKAPSKDAGCGRMVCRACSREDKSGEWTTCLDCLSRDEPMRVSPEPPYLSALVDSC